MTDLFAIAHTLLRYRSGKKRPAEDSPDDEPNPIRQAVRFDKCDPPPENGVLTDMFANDATENDVVYIEKGGTADDFACFARVSLQNMYLNAMTNLEWTEADFSIGAFLEKAVNSEVIEKPLDVPGLSRPFTSEEEARIFPGLSGRFFTSAGRLSSSAKAVIERDDDLQALLEEQYRTKQVGDGRRAELTNLPPIDVFMALSEEDQMGVLEIEIHGLTELHASAVALLSDIVSSDDSIASDVQDYAADLLADKPHAYSSRSKDALLQALQSHDIDKSIIKTILRVLSTYNSHLTSDEQTTVARARRFAAMIDAVTGDPVYGVVKFKFIMCIWKMGQYLAAKSSLPQVKRYDLVFELRPRIDSQSPRTLTFEFSMPNRLHNFYFFPEEGDDMSHREKSIVTKNINMLEQNLQRLEPLELHKTLDDRVYASYKDSRITTTYDNGVVRYVLKAPI